MSKPNIKDLSTVELEFILESYYYPVGNGSVIIHRVNQEPFTYEREELMDLVDEIRVELDRRKIEKGC